METNIRKFPNMMVWIAGIAITLFCVAGIAAIMGWLPTSTGRTAEGSALAIPDKPQAAPSRAAPGLHLIMVT